MGCNVDLRVRPDGAVFAIGINPQPAAFIPEGKFQDLPIIHSLPGAHRAVINIFLTNHLLSGKTLGEVASKVSLAYDEMAPSYNKLAEEQTNTVKGMKSIADAFDFNGNVLDLACGTGNFGRVLSAAKSWADSRKTNQLVGFDISPGMLAICKDAGHYDATYHESFEAALVNSHRYAETIDHIVCF